MLRHDVTPKSLVLDLLRVAPNRMAAPIRSLIEMGELFGFSAGAIRVVVARLTGAGLIESDERGWYRLAPVASPINEFVEQWRLGEARVCPWDRRWLVMWHAHGGSTLERRRSERALTMVGFRRGVERLWVRPNNLARGRDATTALLEHLGVASGCQLLLAEIPAALAVSWTQLWPLAKLEASYRAALAALRRSATRIRTMPNKNALVETFVVGGNAIRILALDPLLPVEIADTELRRALTDAQMRYDAIGRPLWQQVIADATAGRVHRQPTAIARLARRSPGRKRKAQA